MTCPKVKGELQTEAEHYHRRSPVEKVVIVQDACKPSATVDLAGC